MAEVPLFPTTRSPVLTYLPYIESGCMGGSTTLTTFRMGAQIAGHTEEHQPLFTTTIDFPHSGLDGESSRTGICFKSDTRSRTTSGCRQIRSNHVFSYIVLCPGLLPGVGRSGYHQHFPNVLTRISLLEFQRILLDVVSTLLPLAPLGGLIHAPNYFPKPENPGSFVNRVNSIFGIPYLVLRLVGSTISSRQ